MIDHLHFSRFVLPVFRHPVTIFFRPDSPTLSSLFLRKTLILLNPVPKAPLSYIPSSAIFISSKSFLISMVIYLEVSIKVVSNLSGFIRIKRRKCNPSLLNSIKYIQL